ncbi:MAG: hypothetical protein ABIH72_01525 [archaeon]
MVYKLKDFIQESLNHPIFPKGLPDGVEPEEAAQILLEQEVELTPCPANDSWFSGWFPKTVTTADGEKLFEISAKGCPLEGMSYALEFTDLARSYLGKKQ